VSAPTPPPGRRSAQPAQRRGIDVTVLLAVLLPLAVVLAALVVRQDPATTPESGPEEVPLARSTVICPSGAGPVVAATDGETGGPVTVGQGRREETAELAPGRPTELEVGRAPVVLDAEGELAPGLLAGRGGSPLVAPECRPPAFDEWFTGVGAGAKHTSVLELVNPDAGPAVVDTIAYGADGPVAESESVLRGVAVPGHSVVHIDLAAKMPRRDELALHVRATRGRVSAAVLDTYDELGRGPSATDYLPAQAAPSTSNLLLGLPDGRGRRVLLLTNPAETETRAAVKVVTAESTFAAVGSKDIVVPPQSVVRVSISPLLRGRNAKDALGLLVESADPVTATARLFVGGDLTHLAPAPPVTETSAVVPEGTKRLTLGGATRAGAVHVVSHDARGRELADERVEVAPGRGAVLDLPAKAVLVTVTANGTEVVGTVRASGDGDAVLRLRPMVRSGLVPVVRPGLP
jgi:hypothetical protein